MRRHRASADRCRFRTRRRNPQSDERMCVCPHLQLFLSAYPLLATQPMMPSGVQPRPGGVHSAAMWVLSQRPHMRAHAPSYLLPSPGVIVMLLRASLGEGHPPLGCRFRSVRDKQTRAVRPRLAHDHMPTLGVGAFAVGRRCTDGSLLCLVGFLLFCLVCACTCGWGRLGCPRGGRRTSPIMMVRLPRPPPPPTICLLLPRHCSWALGPLPFPRAAWHALHGMESACECAVRCVRRAAVELLPSATATWLRLCVEARPSGLRGA